MQEPSELELFEISPIDLYNNFQQFLIPFLKKKIQAKQIAGKLLILINKIENQPKAVLVMELQHNKNSEIHSVFVDEEYRLKGIGSIMMNKAEIFLKQNNFKNIDIVFFDTWQNKDFLIKYFKRNNWIESQKTVQNFRIDNKKAIKLNWVQNSVKIQDEIVYKSWGEVTEKQRLNLKMKISETKEFPQYLTPFQVIERIELDASQVAIKDDKIIAWSIIHRLSDKIVQCTALYVFPGNRNDNITRRLLARNIFINVQKAYDLTIFQVQYKNDKVRRYLNILFTQNNSINKQYITLASRKNL